MGSNRVTCSVFALGVSLTVRSASAQPTAPEATDPTPPEAGQPADAGRASRPTVVPPRLVHDPGVSYPKPALKQGIHERVEVHLILELNDSGVVVSAQLEQESPAAFAEEALRAAEGLRFEPALRDSVPVPARIRFRYEFAPPPAVL